MTQSIHIADTLEGFGVQAYGDSKLSMVAIPLYRRETDSDGKRGLQIRREPRGFAGTQREWSQGADVTESGGCSGCHFLKRLRKSSFFSCDAALEPKYQNLHTSFLFCGVVL